MQWLANSTLSRNHWSEFTIAGFVLS